MDWLFNSSIPKSTENLVILPPISKTFVNGLAQKYSENYPTQLENLLPKEVFFNSLSQINSYLAVVWPCPTLFWAGYLLSCCTCGGSLCLPLLCVRDAENTMKQLIEQQNIEVFKPRGLELSLQKGCSTSWLQIKVYSRIEMTPLAEKAATSTESVLLLD